MLNTCACIVDRGMKIPKRVRQHWGYKTFCIKSKEWGMECLISEVIIGNLQIVGQEGCRHTDGRKLLARQLRNDGTQRVFS